MKTELEPSAMNCSGMGGCLVQATVSSGHGTVPAAGVATVGRHSCEKNPCAMSRKLGAGGSLAATGTAIIFPAALAAGLPLMKTSSEPLVIKASITGGKTQLAAVSHQLESFTSAPESPAVIPTTAPTASPRATQPTPPVAMVTPVAAAINAPAARQPTDVMAA